MEEKIKEIVAAFIRIPVEEIGPATPIDRRAVKNSIMLHRMYAKLAEAGFMITDYANVKTFGDLSGVQAGGNGHAASVESALGVKEGGGLGPGEEQGLSGEQGPGIDQGPGIERVRGADATHGAGQMHGTERVRTADRVYADERVRPADRAHPAEHGAFPTGDEVFSVGIDIESIESLPRVADFRRDEFYKQNFTPQEMAWCILQADPYESFAGLFAVKEALVKADNSLKEKSFNQIVIGRSPEGRPLYPGFAISIAHANGTAVAVAVRMTAGVAAPTLTLPAATASKNPAGAAISWLALLLAAAAIILSLWHAK